MRASERKRFDYVDDQPEDLAIAAEHDPIALFEIEQLIGELPLSLREPFLLQTLGGFSCAENRHHDRNIRRCRDGAPDPRQTNPAQACSRRGCAGAEERK